MTNNHVRARIISVLSENNPGVLERIAGVIRRRNCNVESSTVGMECPHRARFTIKVSGAQEEITRQMAAQLRKLIEVIRAEDITDQDLLIRELVEIKVVIPDAGSQRTLFQVVDSLSAAKLLDITGDRAIIEVVGSEDEHEKVRATLRAFFKIEVTKPGGIIAVIRGKAPPELVVPPHPCTQNVVESVVS